MDAIKAPKLNELTSKNVADSLAARKFPKTKMKMLAEQVAKLEADSSFQLKDYIINGIPPFDDIFSARFRTPRDKLDWIIKNFLDVERLGASVIINGIPAEKLLDVHVAVSGR